MKTSAALALAAASSPFAGRVLYGDEPKPAARWVSFRNSHDNLGLADGPLPADLQLLWEVATPDGVTSTPVIADGRTYVGTLSGDLHCFELATGKELWKYRSVEQVEPNSFPPGFNAPLALSETAVFGGDDFGTFHAVNRATGKRLWTAATDSEIVGGPQVRGGKVLFGSHDGHLYCHDAAGGERLWAVKTHGPVNATPCLSGKYTFTTGCDQPVLRVVDVEAGEETAEVPIEALLIASPAVRDGILYFGTDSGAVFALDWQNRKTLWEFSVPERQQQIQSSPAVTEDVVIIGSRDKHVYCLDRKTGELRWMFQTRGRVDSSPVVAGDRVYFGASDRTIYGVTLADGKEVWKHPAGQAVTGSPAIAGGYMVIGSDSANGKIFCFGQK